MRVTLIRAWPHHYDELVIDLPEHATVAVALSAAGWDAEAVAIFGVRASVTDVLHPGDRIELLRPLVADPKQARRARANAGRGGSR